MYLTRISSLILINTTKYLSTHVAKVPKVQLQENNSPLNELPVPDPFKQGKYAADIIWLQNSQ